MKHASDSSWLNLMVPSGARLADKAGEELGAGGARSQSAGGELGEWELRIRGGDKQYCAVLAFRYGTISREIDHCKMEETRIVANHQRHAVGEKSLESDKKIDMATVFCWLKLKFEYLYS